jgi:hypothetical protein
MVIAAGQKTGPGGGTHGIHMEIPIPQPIRRQGIYVGCLNERTIAAHIRKARIVKQDVQNIWSVFRCSEPLLPPGSGIAVFRPDLPFESFFRHVYLLESTETIRRFTPAASPEWRRLGEEEKKKKMKKRIHKKTIDQNGLKRGAFCRGTLPGPLQFFMIDQSMIGLPMIFS